MTKVRCNRNFHYQSPLFKGHVCRSCGQGFNFSVAFSQISNVGLEFKSIASNSLTNSLFSILAVTGCCVKMCLFWLCNCI